MRSYSRLGLLDLVTFGLCCALAASPALAEDIPAAAPTDAPAPVSVEATAAAATTAEPAAPAQPEIPRELIRDLRTAEAQVHDLKERVFRTKATLELLRELVVEGSGTGSKLEIVHVDDMKRGYAIEGVQYYLDGKSVFTWAKSDGTPLPEELTVSSMSIAPGTHAVQVTLSLRGDGGKVFEYVDTYGFKVESTYSFEVPSGMVTELRVRALTKGGVKKAYTERPTVVYEEHNEPVAE